VEEEVRSRVEARLARQFPHLEVRVRSAHLAGDGIEIRGVSIIEPDVTGPQPELAYLDEVFLECRTDLQELVKGDPEITLVKLIGPVLRATRRPNGHFSIARLLGSERSGAPLPPVVIEGGVVEVFDPLKNPSSTLTLRDIHVKIRPRGDAPSRVLDVQGYVVGDYLQRVEVVGTIEPDAARWTFSGTVDGLEISPELRHALPEPLAGSLEVLAGVRAPANLSFRVADDGTDATPQFEINGQVEGGRVEHPLLPYPLTDLKARIHCDNTGFRISDLTAHHGQTTWAVTQFDRSGYGPDSPCVVRATGRQVRLDRAWRDTLPPAWRQHWINYDPEGDVNVECTLSFDGRAWKPTLQITCVNNVSFSCHKFPYRLERGQGSLSLRHQQLEVNLVAFSGAQPVTLKGSFQNPGPQYTGSMEIWGEKIQFDEKLFAGILKEKSRRAVRSLNPKGTFDFHCRLWRAPNDPLPRPLIHQHLRVSVNRCSVTFDKLPYPLNNLQGRLEMRDGQWMTEPQLVGTNDTGVVTLKGKLATSPDLDVLVLHIDARNVPLEEELRDALPPAQQQIWNALRPRGNVDLEADVTYNSRVRKPSIDLWLVPHGGALPSDRQNGIVAGQPGTAAVARAASFDPRDQTPPEALSTAGPDELGSIGTSLAPVAFPYRMERLGGTVHYRDGHVELKDVHAEHRGTKLRTGGWCDFLPDGSWRLRLERLSVDRIRLHGEDYELVAALPESLRRAVGELRPTGPMNLKGVVEFAKAHPQAPLQTTWDVDLFLHRASLQVGPRLDNVFGAVRLQGSSQGPRYTSFGELKLDSLTFKNFQFTEILGPLWFDNERVYLGTLPFPLPNGQKSGRITARLFGGLVAADCQVRLGAVPHYRLLASLSGANLAQFAAENLTNHQTLNGKVLASVDLQGSRGQHTLVGTGDIHLTEADVYELPLMVSLLKIVRAKRPDTTAFTESDVTFQINGQHVALKKIDLRGDALSLSGHGELTLDAQTNPIRLELHTTVGRGAVPLISGMFSEASQQILKIHVDGTLDKPNTWTEAFPVAAEALDRLRTDMEQPAPRTGGPLWPFGARR
jgi:hypothetical protein